MLLEKLLFRLKAAARFNVAERLAKLFCAKTGFQASTEFDAECFLASLQRDLESWLRQGRKCGTVSVSS